MIKLIALSESCNSNARIPVELESFTQEQIDSLKRAECDSLYSRIERANADTLGRITDVPETFEQSLVSLDDMLNSQMKDLRWSGKTGHETGVS